MTELELSILLIDARKAQYDSKEEVNLTCERNMPENATHHLIVSLKEKIATDKYWINISQCLLIFT